MQNHQLARAKYQFCDSPNESLMFQNKNCAKMGFLNMISSSVHYRVSHRITIPLLLPFRSQLSDSLYINGDL